MSAPTITLISPNTGPTTGNTDIVITGTNLTGTTDVTVGGVPATNVVVVNATTVTARTPAGAAGAKNVVVTTPGGSATATGGYIYAEAPQITGQPSASTIAAGGNTTFMVTASNATGYQWQVNTGSGYNNISNGGVYSGATTATLSITGATTGMDGYVYRVVVTGDTTPNATSSGVTLTVNAAPAPVITGLSPDEGGTLGGYTVVLSGSHLTGATAVTIGGKAATSYTVNSDEQISFIVPSGSVGKVDVVVTTPNGTDTLTEGYTYFQSNVAQESWATVEGNSVDNVIVPDTIGETPDAFVIYAAPEHGTATVSGASILYTPTPGYTGEDMLIFSAQKDGKVFNSFPPVWITVTPPVLSITGQPSASTIAAGGNTTFMVTASNATGYQWQVNTGSGYNNISNGGVYSGATTATLNITGATADMNGYMYRTVASGAGGAEVTSSPAALTVQSPPSITSQPSDSSIAAGTNTTFTVAASNATSYQWQVDQGAGYTNVVNGGVYSGAGTATLTITGATAGMSGYMYRAVASGAAAPDATSNGVVLTVLSPPAIIGQPAASTIAAGANASFSVTATDATSYQWQVDQGSGYTNVVNGGVYSGAGTATLTITGATAGLNGYMYRAVASGAVAPDATSNGVVLTVLSPPAIIGQPAASTIAAGTNTSFSVTATDATSYQWQVNQGSGYTDVVNGGVYSGATSPTLTITGATAGMSGYMYRAVASGAAAPNATSTGATLTVISPPSITSQPSASTITAGENTSFTVTATDATSYQWQVDQGFGYTNVVNGGVYSGAGTATLTITGATAVLNGYMYRVVVIGSVFPIATSNGAALTVNVPPTIFSMSPAFGPLAGGTTVTITGAHFTGATSVTFDGVAGTGLMVTSANSITVTTPAGAEEGAKDVVVTTPGGSVTDAGGFTYIAAPVITSFTPDYGPAAGGTSVTLTGSGLSGATVEIEGPGGIEHSATVTSSTANSLTFMTPAATAGLKGIIVTTPGGQFRSLTPYTYFDPPTISNISPATGTTAGGTSVTLTGTNYTNPSVTIGGMSATVTASTANSITLTTPSATAGVKDVVVSDMGGSVTLTSGFEYIYPAPQITSQPSDVTISAGRGVAFNAATSNATSYQWQVNSGSGYADINDDGVYSGATTNTLIITGATVTMNGYQYRLVATGATSPAATSNAATLTVNAVFQAVAFISTAPVGAVVGDTYAVTALASSALTPVITVDAGSAAICSIAGDTVTFNAAGTCTLNADQAGDGTYAAATQVQQDITVGLAAQTLSFTSTAPVGAVVGGTYAVTASATSGLTPVITVDAGSAAICSIAGDTVTFNGAGICRLNADQAGDGTYAAATQVQQDITVGLAAQTLSFTSTAPVGAVVGGTYAVTASATSGLTPVITVDAGSAAICSIAGGTVTFNAAGTCTLNADQAGDGTYAAATQVQQDITVGLAAQTLSFTSTAPVGAVVGDTYAVTALASSALTPVITVDAGSAAICSLAGDTVTFNAAGTCTLNANQAGDGTYAAATQVQQDITVGLAAQTLSFTSPAPVGAVVGGTYAVTASASSALTPVITVDAGSAAICSIAGDTVTFNGAGICRLNADQAGDGTYSAATQVQQDITVGLAAPQITGLSPDRGGTIGGYTSIITGSALSDATAVMMGDTPAISYTVNSDTQITVIVPAHTPGSVDVVVTTPGGTVTLADGYTYEQSNLAQESWATVAANSVNNVIVPDTIGETPDRFTIYMAPEHGTATVSGASIIYTPNPGYSGQDRIFYQAYKDNAVFSSVPPVWITVTPPVLSVSPAAGTLPEAVAGTAYNVTLTASEGTAPYSYVLKSGALPDSLSLNGTTGMISGTPAQTGSFSFTITVSDANLALTDVAYSLNVVPAVSTNASLSGLTLSEGALSPAFAAGTTSYSASVANAVTSLTLTPVAADSGATLTVNGTAVASGQTSAAIPLVVGANTLTVEVTAEDGTTIRTYTLNVTRAALSANASLSGLHLSEGSLSPAFAAGTTGYTVTVDNEVSSLTLTPAAADSGATLTVNGTAVTSGQTSAAIPLAVGVNTIPVVVTAEDGETTRTYTLTIRRDSLLVVTPATGDLTAGVVNEAYSTTVSVSGGIGPYGFAVTSGALPNGLTLNPDTGLISGVPEAGGSYAFTLTVTDANNATAQFSYGLNIAMPPAPEVSNPDPTSVPANTSTQAGQSVSMNLSELVQGQFDDIQIVTQPQHGTVTLIHTPAVQGGGLPAVALAMASLSAPEQIVAVYTPEANYHGSDSYQFVAVGPGGASSPATVMIEVQGTVPTAASRTVTVIDGQTVAVELTEGASEGPFTAATIVRVTPDEAATVRIVEGGVAGNRTYRMEITPKVRFSGDIAVAYTLSNAFGESAQATITARVTARPDPSADPTVRAISDAQVETARRFSRAQVANFMRRTESLHGLDCGASGSTVQLSAQSRPQGPRYQGDTEYLKDDRYANDDTEQTAPVGGNAPASRMPSDGSVSSAAGERCANRYAVWAGGTIDLSDYDAVSDRSKISASTSGLSFGLDRQVRDGLIMGAGFGFGNDTSRIAGGDARVRSESQVAAVYGSYTLSPDVFIDAVIVHARLSFDTRRVDATTQLTVRGERDGRFTTGAVSAGLERSNGPRFWSVYGRGEYMTGSLEAYREQGAGIYDLRFDERDLRSFTGVLGFRGRYQYPVSFGMITSGLRMEWQHEFANSTDQRLDYADVVGPAFYGLTTQGWAREQYLITPSLELTLTSGWQIGMEVGLRTAGKETATSATMQLQKPF